MLKLVLQISQHTIRIQTTNFAYPWFPYHNCSHIKLKKYDLFGTTLRNFCTAVSKEWKLEKREEIQSM